LTKQKSKKKISSVKYQQFTAPVDVGEELAVEGLRRTHLVRHNLLMRFFCLNDFNFK
jgi:hypothetical protein